MGLSVIELMHHEDEQTEKRSRQFIGDQQTGRVLEAGQYACVSVVEFRHSFVELALKCFVCNYRVVLPLMNIAEGTVKSDRKCAGVARGGGQLRRLRRDLAHQNGCG